MDVSVKGWNSVEDSVPGPVKNEANVNRLLFMEPRDCGIGPRLKDSLESGSISYGMAGVVVRVVCVVCCADGAPEPLNISRRRSFGSPTVAGSIESTLNTSKEPVTVPSMVNEIPVSVPSEESNWFQVRFRELVDKALNDCNWLIVAVCAAEVIAMAVATTRATLIFETVAARRERVLFTIA